MTEKKEGALASGSGKKVTSRKREVAKSKEASAWTI
jgi:hypothetical protein